ncbi:MAG TPA: glycerol-3-phosphate acyltransferase [candidate division Zixibacteria bacterium]|nr:glycerol-3-phosphate acyltransferase [candidate division Zixibacteria bacterium]
MALINILWLFLGLLGSFISGSIPYSVLIGRLATGKDLRNFNIGNPGGFNAVMTYGLPIGMTVIYVDILKGLIPIALLDWIFHMDYFMNDSSIWHTLIVILGPAVCILGHNHSPFLKFKGGRGSAVFIGTLLWMNPLVLITFFIPFGLMIGLLKVPTRLSNILAVVFFAPASLFITIYPPWNWIYSLAWIGEIAGKVTFYWTPFFIALAMWIAWLPRHWPSIIAAIKGEEWTLSITEGQQFSEKFDTQKDEATRE